MKNNISVYTALEIVNNYPERILIEPETIDGKWFGVIYFLNDNLTLDRLASQRKKIGFDGYETKKEAILIMEEAILEMALELERKKNHEIGF